MTAMMSAQSSPRSPLEVSALLEAPSLGLSLIAGSEGMGRSITSAEVQKPGLALAGHLESLHADRVQILGYSEISYLETLEAGMSWTRAHELCAPRPPAVIVTRGLEIPPGLVAACTEEQVALMRTARSTSELMDRLRAHLAACLSPTASMHGVLVDVFGIGILLLGKSGIGKSELALDLVMRGHRLVADDIVELRRESGRTISGAGPEIIKHHMEIRGLGILNIKDLFGIAAVRDAKRVELVVELVEWNEEEEYDRLGVDEQAYEVLGVAISHVRLPVRPGRNMTSIIEVAARNQLLKVQGHHSAREFQDRLVRAIASSRIGREFSTDVEVE